MTTCPSCGSPIEPHEKMCSECGTRLEGATESFAPVDVEQPQLPSEFGATSGPVLVVRKGHDLGERFYVEAETMSIGRDPASDVFLNDITVSRRHAIVSRAGDEVSVQDAGSLNGTYVNGVCVDRAILSQGDILQIGMFQMVFIAGTQDV